MPRRTFYLLLISALCGLTLSGCSTPTPPVPQLQRSAWSACDQEWVLASLSYSGRTYESTLMWSKFWRNRPFFKCDRFGYVRGNGGINPYLGRFSLASTGAISWQRIPAISRMGELQPSDELEIDYLNALRKSELMVVVGNKMMLSSTDGSSRIEFDLVDRSYRQARPYKKGDPLGRQNHNQEESKR
ncbi:META domain-containing protein [Microbulbifer sp. OS29]|uniref:META domain-containing protein n=1 Tax=Microbulbifer okhotskensis TaxID=2926617 RepID=A0A9X2ENQ9_9GAMM|nr:META domain-containing protein [Microbulbifer okhotskensis]MCO1335019.1 META domain-containing protein [Microbulbifer okhotskensis]